MTNLLIKLFIRDSHNISDKTVRTKYGSLGSGMGICANILLFIIKITVGLTTKSISIVADALNNLSDMGSSVITMIGFKLANKPADRDHPYGHGRMEYISAFTVAVLILLVGFELLTSSVETLINGDAAPIFSNAAIVVLVISILFKFWMFLFNRKLGRTINSSALLATAKDSINDSISTLAILVAAIISRIFTVPFNLDAVMAIGVAVFILFSGFNAARDTIREILGTPPERELIEELEREILAFDGFLGIHDLIIHNYGPGRQFASVHVEVPQDIDIVECHERIDICEKVVCEKTGIELVIHMDPIDVNNSAVTAAKEAVSNAIKTIDENLTLHDFRMTPNAASKTNLIFDVVVPHKLKMSEVELREKICEKAREINPTYCCVITFDTDYTGK